MTVETNRSVKKRKGRGRNNGELREEGGEEGRTDGQSYYMSHGRKRPFGRF